MIFDALGCMYSASDHCRQVYSLLLFIVVIPLMPAERWKLATWTEAGCLKDDLSLGLKGKQHILKPKAGESRIQSESSLKCRVRWSPRQEADTGLKVLCSHVQK